MSLCEKYCSINFEKSQVLFSKTTEEKNFTLNTSGIMQTWETLTSP